MPLPNPRKNEKKAEYVSRCISFVHRESKRERTQAQISAMCIANWETKHLQQVRFLAQSPKFSKMSNNALLIEGDLLKPGVFIGLDGVPTHYSEEFITKVGDTIIGKPIRFAHEISSKSMSKSIPKGTTVGFWTGFTGKNALKVRGYVFDPIAIGYLEENPRTGLSMEAQVYAEYDAQLGVEDAKSGMLTGGALIEDPACPSCRLHTVREVSLGDRNQKMKGVLNVSAEEEHLLEEEVENPDEPLERPDEPCVEAKEMAKGTRKEFFTWMEKQLRDAKLKDETVKTMLALLRKAILSPLPIPKPTAQAAEEEEGEGEEEETGDLWEKVKAKLAAVGLDEAVVSKVVSALKGLIKTPYPYPKADERLVKDLADLRAEVKRLTEERNAVQEKAYEEALVKVKNLDKDFDEKMLESFDCPAKKRVFLERYAAALSKHVRPIKLQVSNKKTEDAAKSAIGEMFGEDATFAKIFDLPEERT